jgi:hypothetical protein
MAGRVGRSGRPRKPLLDHIRDGTYRFDRHGPLPADLPASGSAVVAFPVPTPPPAVPDDLLAGLKDAGRALVEQLWKDYQFSTATTPLLHELGRQADRLAEARTALVDKPLVYKNSRNEPQLNPLLRAERNAVHTLMAIFNQLDLEK